MTTYIIAEIGVNHNGSVHRAKDMIKIAAEAQVDAVKFQIFSAKKLVTTLAKKADYQKDIQFPEESQLEMLKKLELGHQDIKELKNYTESCGLDFLATPFDLESLCFLIDTLSVDQLKLGSGDLTNGPLLWEAAASGLPLILSTGMAKISEIETALQVVFFARSKQAPENIFHNEFSLDIAKEYLNNIILLHCTSAYPTPLEDVNLNAMATMKQRWNLPVGYSDHTEGINVSIIAATQGACVIEKHFTLDRTLPGPDHFASIEPDELKNMVNNIREIDQISGDGEKKARPSEKNTREIARRSLVAARPIALGAPFTKQNIAILRPGDGMSPMLFWQLLKNKSSKKYNKGDLINEHIC